jgi:hypothetical protein
MSVSSVTGVAYSSGEFYLLGCDVTVKFVPGSLILFTLMMVAIRSSEKSVLTRATWRHIPENDILHSNRRENLKFYITLTGWALYRRRNVSPVRYLYP